MKLTIYQYYVSKLRSLINHEKKYILSCGYVKCVVVLLNLSLFQRNVPECLYCYQEGTKALSPVEIHNHTQTCSKFLYEALVNTY